MVKLNLPLRPWVPQWLGIVTMFVVMFPIIMLNGTYTGSMLEVSSTLGILSEDITMGYYAAAAGMAVAYPIIPKIRAIATPKTMLLTDLILQIFLSYICAQVGNMDITIICSSLCWSLLFRYARSSVRRMCVASSTPTSTPSYFPVDKYPWR